MAPRNPTADEEPNFKDKIWEATRAAIVEGGKTVEEAVEILRSCQEIGLVTLMFFFELLFSYVSLAISLYDSLLLTYPQSFFSLSADYLRHSR